MTDKPTGGSFAALFEAEATDHKAKKQRVPGLGERVRAEVIQLGKDDVFVELVSTGAGKRVSAYLSHEDVRGPDGSVALKVGDAIEAVVVDNKDGELRLGRTMGKPQGRR